MSGMDVRLTIDPNRSKDSTGAWAPLVFNIQYSVFSIQCVTSRSARNVLIISRNGRKIGSCPPACFRGCARIDSRNEVRIAIHLSPLWFDGLAL
jgi:hypothetical protein